MKVILLEDISGVGKLGEVINVRRGFARNYLFPQAKAEHANDAAVAEFEKRRSVLEERQAAQQAAMETARTTLTGYLLQIAMRASPDGNLYGSITAQIIANALNKQGIVENLNIKRGQIVLPEGPLKSTGEHEVVVNLQTHTQVRIIVSVLAETVDTGNEQAPSNGGDAAQKEEEPMQKGNQ